MEVEEDVYILKEGENSCKLPSDADRKLRSSSSGESGFSGFTRLQGTRIEDDLEIVEEVIRDIMPGRKKCPIHSKKLHYRERKVGYNFGKVIKIEKIPQVYDLEEPDCTEENDNGKKNANTVISIMKRNSAEKRPLSPSEDLLLIDENEMNTEMSSPQVNYHSESSEDPLALEFDISPSNKSKKRRSFAAMRPSVILRDIMKEKWLSHDIRSSFSLNSSFLVNVEDSLKENEVIERPVEGITDRIKDKSIAGKNSLPRPPKRAATYINIISHLDYGRLVWGKSGSSRPWPAVIVNHTDCGERKPIDGKAWILWYGDYRITEVLLPKLSDFITNFKATYANTYHEKYRIAVLECLKECRERSKLPVFDTKKEYIKWGENGLSGAKNMAPNNDSYCCSKIQQYLRRIRKMRSREKSSSDRSSFPTSSSSASDDCAEERMAWKPKAALLKEVRKGTRDIETLCIACDRINCNVAGPHPYFLGGTCEKCKEELEDISSCAPDGSMYCLICGSPGELIVCDDSECERVFCTGCIELLVSPKAVDDIMKSDPWFCFLCEDFDKATHGLLKPRPDWKEKVASTEQAASKSIYDVPEVEEDTPPISSFEKRPLRVLSLFDGISTGLLVLDKLNLDVEVYYTSEINEDAKNVSCLNFGDRITEIGDVQTLTDKKLAELCPIDLLIGGSPCNDLSFVNPARKGLFNPTGTGILFFHYFRALKTIQLLNKGVHLFWLFENVQHMPREFKTQISIFLQREPCVIDSKFFSPQNRARCYWGNIPDMYKPLPPEVIAKSHPLSDYVAKIGKRTALSDKVNCITTNTNSLKPVIRMNDHEDYPWITEIEEIFGFPKHYTDVGNLSNRQRQALLGRSWSVSVIAYILKPLTKYYPSKTSTKDMIVSHSSTSTTTMNGCSPGTGRNMNKENSTYGK